MQSLGKNEILEFNPDTLEAVRRAFELDVRKIVQSVDTFQEWIKKQDHFLKKEFSREFLERALITAKGSVEKAKRTLDSLLTVRTTAPYLFTKYDAKNQFNELFDNMQSVFMPKLTEDHYRIYVIKLTEHKPTSELLLDYYLYTVIMCEYVRAHEYCQGFIIVHDHRDVNVTSTLSALNLNDLRNFIQMIFDGFGMRVKDIHLVSSSKFVDKFLSLGKQLLSSKISKRIQIHKDLESLHQHVPRRLLPADLGGEQEPLRNIQDKWIEVLSTEKNMEYIKMMNRAGTDETYRRTDRFNEDCLGMPGTFRTLTVD